MAEAPSFIDRDPAAITAEMVASVETLLGKTLYPAQGERLMIDFFAYRESLVREAINDAATQNLVRYARAPMLDELGLLVGVARLEATPAKTTVRLALSAAPSGSVAIPAGWRVATGGGVQFQTLVETVVPAGAMVVDLAVRAVETGSAGNGYLPGQINTVVDVVALSIASVANLATTSGGAAAEDDERLRTRIMLAPESFSTAGSVGAYRFHALRAHPDIIDVAVLSPSPGVVSLYPLLSSGQPGPPVLEAVLATCSSEKVRPLCDTVQALPPEAVDYAIVAELTLKTTANASVTLEAANAAAAVYAARLSGGLGRDIVPSQIIAALSLSGVYQVSLSSPAATTVVAEHQWARLIGITLTVGGTADG